MKTKSLITAVASFLAAFSVPAFAADYQWVGTTTTWATASNWKVWDGSAWATATTSPTTGDSILGNTSVLSLTIPATVSSLNVLGATTAADTYLINTALSVNTLQVSLSSPSGAHTVRGTGTLSVGTIDIESGSLGFGSGGTTIGGLTVSSGVIIKGNLNIAVSSSAAVSNVIASNYSLGTLTFSSTTATNSVYLAYTPTLRTANLAANATVSGLSTDAGVYGRIYGGSTAVSTAALSAAPGSNTANLYINVASGGNYSANVGLMELTQTGYLGEVKTNTLSVIKLGEGTQILTASTSNYTGGTTVSAGTLLVNNTAGSGIGYGNAVVQSGARLGGSGIIALSSSNTLTIESGGLLLAGDGSSGTSLTVKNSVVMANDSVLEVALGASGATSSLVIGTGGSLTAGSIILSILDVGVTEGSYSLITGLSGDPGVSNWTVTGLDPLTWSTLLSYDAGTVSLTLTAVPEPAVSALGLSVLALLWVARRRRS